MSTTVSSIDGGETGYAFLGLRAFSWVARFEEPCCIGEDIDPIPCGGAELAAGEGDLPGKQDSVRRRLRERGVRCEYFRGLGCSFYRTSRGWPRSYPLARVIGDGGGSIYGAESARRAA